MSSEAVPLSNIDQNVSTVDKMSQTDSNVAPTNESVPDSSWMVAALTDTVEPEDKVLLNPVTPVLISIPDYCVR